MKFNNLVKGAICAIMLLMMVTSPAWGKDKKKTFGKVLGGFLGLGQEEQKKKEEEEKKQKELEAQQKQKEEVENLMKSLKVEMEKSVRQDNPEFTDEDVSYVMENFNFSDPAFIESDSFQLNHLFDTYRRKPNFDKTVNSNKEKGDFVFKNMSPGDSLIHVGAVMKEIGRKNNQDVFIKKEGFLQSVYGNYYVFADQWKFNPDNKNCKYLLCSMDENKKGVKSFIIYPKGIDFLFYGGEREWPYEIPVEPFLDKFSSAYEVQFETSFENGTLFYKCIDEKKGFKIIVLDDKGGLYAPAGLSMIVESISVVKKEEFD
jgi:hypothetical protein